MDPVIVTCLLVCALEAIAGISTNLFILSNIFIDEFYKKRSSAKNKFLAALTISNVLYTVMLSVNVFSSFFMTDMYNLIYVSYIVLILTLYGIMSCSWLTACLCFMYFVKITHFRCRSFSWVKRNISTIAPWLILAVEAVSLCSSCLDIFISPASKNSSTYLLANRTLSIERAMPKNMYFGFIANCVPFLISIVTTASTVWSLRQHSRRIEKNVGTFGNITVYQNAVRTMIRLLIFYAEFYVVTFFNYFNYYYLIYPWVLVFLLMMFSFAPVQAAVLILGNHKLKKSLIRMFHCMKARVDNSTG